MHARLSRIQLAPETYEQGVHMARTQILPSIRLMPGYKGYVVLGDRASNSAIVLSLWESEEDERASDQEAAVLREDSAAALGLEELSVERYEVVVFEAKD